jgi:SSS family solute:Na+ symporter
MYTTMGGMLADAIADVVQYLIIFFGLLIALPFIIKGAGGWATVSSMLPPVELSFTKIGFVTIIGLIFNYFCTFLSGPEMVSRFSSSEDANTAQKAAILSAVMMGMLAFIPTLIGLVALAENPGLDGGKGTTALMYATTHYAPSWVTGAVAAAIVAATMSSADSNLLCSSTILIKDIYQKFFNPSVDDRKLIIMTRTSNVIICLISACIAMFKVNLVTLNLFAFALRSAGPFAAYALGMTVKEATKNSGIVSIVVGSVAVNVPAAFPKRRFTTSGIVTAIVLRIFGAKYARGIIATAAASTYHAALKPHPENAFAATPVVLPPPMLFAEREDATMNKPILRPASM